MTLVAPTAFADETIESPGPLTSILTTSDLNCAVHVDGDDAGEWYGNTACGTFLAVGKQVYGPAVVPAGPEFTPWKPVSQTGVTGSGTEDDPFTVVTVVAAGKTGLQVTQTVTYATGSHQYTTSVSVANTSASDKSVVLYRAGDCYQQDSDTGFGRVDGTSVSCVAEVPFSDPVEPSTRIEQMIPLTPGSSYLEGQFSSTVWAAVASGKPFPNTCECDVDQDNGEGLSWAITVPASSQVTEQQATYFSPAPLRTTATAENSPVLPGAQDGYTITISNPSTVAVTLASITDLLPDGFIYVAGSTTGATTSDPTVVGQQLSWDGSFPVQPRDGVSLSFRVTVATTPGSYFDTAGGTVAGGGDQTIDSSGPTAEIDVQPIAITKLSPAALVVGASQVNIHITGTMFTSDASVALGAGVSVNSVHVQSRTSLTVNVSVASDAPLGPRDVTLTELSGSAICSSCFTVDPVPTIISIKPSSRGQGAAKQEVAIVGTGFNLGASVTVSGTGVKVDALTRRGPTKLIAVISVAFNASIGDHTLTVTNKDHGSATGTFTVNPAPKPATATPPVARGSTQDVTITGTDFVPGDGLSVTINVKGVTVSAPTSATSTSITVTVTVTTKAKPGTYKLTVTNPDAGTGSSKCFTIT